MQMSCNKWLQLIERPQSLFWRTVYIIWIHPTFWNPTFHRSGCWTLAIPIDPHQFYQETPATMMSPRGMIQAEVPCREVGHILQIFLGVSPSWKLGWPFFFLQDIGILQRILLWTTAVALAPAKIDDLRTDLVRFWNGWKCFGILPAYLLFLSSSDPLAATSPLWSQNMFSVCH